MILYQEIPKLVFLCNTCPRTPQDITDQPKLCGCSGAQTVTVSGLSAHPDSSSCSCGAEGKEGAILAPAR